MTATSIRYMREKGQIELALQMIAYEARTHTIRGCTGLSDDRIRRLYSTYFKDANGISVKRQRGKSPKRIDTYTSSLERQRHAATLASLLVQFDLVSYHQEHTADYSQPNDHKGIAYGTRFCRAYALYVAISQTPKFCFERAWSLCEALNEASELCIENCRECSGLYVQDRLSLHNQVCSCCRIKSN